MSTLDPDELRAQFPATPARGYDSARDDAPPDEQEYGKARVVNRTAHKPDMTKADAERVFEGRGVAFDDVYADARWFCAVVYE